MVLFLGFPIDSSTDFTTLILNTQISNSCVIEWLYCEHFYLSGIFFQSCCEVFKSYQWSSSTLLFLCIWSWSMSWWMTIYSSRRTNPAPWVRLLNPRFYPSNLPFKGIELSILKPSSKKIWCVETPKKNHLKIETYFFFDWNLSSPKITIEQSHKTSKSNPGNPHDNRQEDVMLPDYVSSATTLLCHGDSRRLFAAKMWND